MKEEKGPLIFLVLFMVLSIVFGVFAYMNNGELHGVTPDDSKEAKIKALKKQIQEKEDQISVFRAKAEVLRREIAKAHAEYDGYRELNDIYADEYNRRQALKKGAENFQEQATKLAESIVRVKNQTLESVDKDIREQKNLMEKELGDKTKAKEDAIARFRSLEEDLKSEVTKNRSVKNYHQSSLDDSKSTLSDLTARDVERATIFNNSDGKVILSDPLHNIIVINRGTSDGVKNGYRFEVFTLRGSNRVSKGYIEVRKADPSRAECLIVTRAVDLPKDPLSNYVASDPEALFSPYQESGKKGASAQLLSGTPKTKAIGVNTEDPIVEGDDIVNPFYSPGKTFTFYIAANKEIINERQKSAIRYKWNEIKAVCETYGSQVASRVDVNVNFMIAQKNPKDDPEFQKGVDLGIPVIYEWELFRFLDNR